jgi:mannose-6-phosphate isomerase-like protein (cupin superfamily)
MVKGTFLVKVAERTVYVSKGVSPFFPGGITHAFQNVGTDLLLSQEKHTEGGIAL